MQEALQTVREFLPTCWLWSHQNYINGGQNFFLDKRTEVPTPLSTDMCRHTTLFLLQLLKLAGDTTWKVAGGFVNYRDEPGVFEKSGHWGQHWWLESGDRLLDLTADQVGWENVVLTTVDDPRYCRKPELSLKKFVSTLERTVAQWRGEPTSFWMAHDPRFQEIKRQYPAVVEQFVAAWPKPSVATAKKPKGASTLSM